MANQELTSFRENTVKLDEFVLIAKALSSGLRIAIFRELLKRAMNVIEISEFFRIPASTAAISVRRLEEAGLIKTELLPGTRGTQKLCAAVFTRIILDATEVVTPPDDTFVLVEMPIGHFFDAIVYPTCGMVNSTSVIGEYDHPGTFYLPDRVDAQLMWFRHGYVEYRFPNRVPPGKKIVSLELTMEVCSEAPLYNLKWPSDITVWINGVEIGTWTSPSDFGGERGVLTPTWWGIQNTQYGLLKTWRVSSDGSFIDGIKLRHSGIADIPNLDDPSFVTVRIGVNDSAMNVGGINLFGKRFGNYATDLLLRMDFV